MRRGLLAALIAGLGTALMAAPASAEVDWMSFDFGVPLQVPFVCENEAPAFNLGPATDEWCQTESRVDYVYRNKDGVWQPFDVNGPRPDDIAETATSDQIVVPMIARREIGKTPNGSSYIIGMLYDPALNAEPSPETRSPGWNGKVIMTYGGGVQANYHSGQTGGGFDINRYFLGDNGSIGYNDVAIERGYAIINGSLMVMGSNNDDIKSAQTTAQVKKIFVEHYGEPIFTVGAGASGGSMQQHLIASNYPGLLDGIVPKRSYPDGLTFLQPLYDCELFVDHYKHSDLLWTDAERTAVEGYATSRWCAQSNGERYPNDEPTNCNAAVLDAVSADEKLIGVRCTYADNMRYVYGLEDNPDALDALGNPAGKAAPLPWDNVGVQYGLLAFNDGKIDFEHFIDLNRGMGGLDINGEVQDARTAADPAVVQIAYETGRIVSGKGLSDIPIVDIRRWRDLPMAGDNPDNLDVHDAAHSRAIRARLIAANGNADNQVVITTADSANRLPGSPIAAAIGRVVDQMDQWIMAIKADTRPISQHDKVVANKPADLVDACYLSAGQKITSAELCAEVFPYHDHPRLIAGAPQTEDIIKCQLKPVDAADYSASLTEDQLSQIRDVFPEGVCDYSKPGVGQVAMAGTWLGYDGKGGWTVGQPF